MTSVPHYWEDAKHALSAVDPVMAGIIACYQGEGLRSRGDAFETLARSIVGQQISVKAADSVWQKFEAVCTSQRDGGVKPRLIQQLREEELRACGLSRQKILYLGEIAAFFIKHKVKAGFFDELSDAEAIAALTSIKGIGKWTAEMFLIFHLMRPDVFPIDDIGVQKGLMRHYEVGEKIDKKQMIGFSSRWQPWRSVATWYLWRSLDPVPVAY